VSSFAPSKAAQERFEHLAEQKLEALLTKIGRPFLSRRQVKVTAMHKPDVVWFESRLPKRLFPQLRWGIPVVGFEIESSGAAQSIKAAINNLEALKPALGCIIIPKKVAERKRAERWGSRYVGLTVKQAVEYLASKSWLSIVVLTDEGIDDFTTGRDEVRERVALNALMQQITKDFERPAPSCGT
jgi:hypothetical protein